MKEAAEFCPKNRSEWREWLSECHQKEDAIWLIFYKKKSPDHNLSWSDAVDEALCFGWIDSTKITIDNERYKQYFTKRKAKSNWSKINKDKVTVLIEEGLMQQAGYDSIAIAKENGSWTFLDAVEALEVPQDLQSAFDQNDKAQKFYNELSNSMKKGVLYWVISAKREATQQKRIRDIVDSAEMGKLPKHFG